MGIALFEISDCPDFLSLARGEGWICDQWEMDFLLGSFPGSCFVWKELGAPRAFITAANYGESGWIGNLIVSPQLRGRGIGTMLMQQSLAALERGGVKTVWLTASTAGEPIYEKLGFKTVDTVCRLRGSGGIPPSPQDPNDPSIITALDRSGWGGSREPALAMLTNRGTLLLDEDGFLICNYCSDGVQLGPWGSRTAEAAARLLERVLSPSGERVTMFLDAPMKNREAARLLCAHGFVAAGSTQLMYRGAAPSYNPAVIYALASMGSFG